MRDGKSDLTVGLATHPSIYPSTYLRFIEVFSARVYLPAYPPLCVLVFTFLSVHLSSTCTLLVSLCFRYLPTCLPISRSLSLSFSLCPSMFRFNLSVYHDWGLCFARAIICIDLIAALCCLVDTDSYLCLIISTCECHHTYTCAYVDAHIYIQRDRQKDSQTVTHSYILRDIQAYRHLIMHTYIHTYIHTHAHIHIYIFLLTHLIHCGVCIICIYLCLYLDSSVYLFVFSFIYACA